MTKEMKVKLFLKNFYAWSGVVYSVKSHLKGSLRNVETYTASTKETPVETMSL